MIRVNLTKGPFPSSWSFGKCAGLEQRWLRRARRWNSDAAWLVATMLGYRAAVVLHANAGDTHGVDRMMLAIASVRHSLKVKYRCAL